MDDCETLMFLRVKLRDMEGNYTIWILHQGFFSYDRDRPD